VPSIAPGYFGPPKFDAAAFQYAGGKLDLASAVLLAQELQTR
jgi:hypothetical protein